MSEQKATASQRQDQKQPPKQPLIRIARRPTIPQRQAWLIRISAFIAALLCGALLIALLGHNPFHVYADMVSGALYSPTSRAETIQITIPLLVAALSVALSFKMQFWNIGAEGQILAGGIAATYFALFWVGDLPSWLLLIVMGLAGCAGGAIWGAIPAFFKAKWNTNETLLTLMLNYVALGIVKYLAAGPWKKASAGGFPKIAMFDKEARLPEIFDVHIGWIIALILLVLYFVYLNRSKHGYETIVVGQSTNTAKYSGMSVPRVLIRTMLLAGALSGLAGFMQVSGADYTLNEMTAGGVGFTAITVAWLGQLKPVPMLAVAFFIAVLEKGASRIQTTFAIPASASDVLVGGILFFMLACEFFINYRLIFRTKKGEASHG
jgi:general nucleoside transport system permease protein